jgi:hypothetical protein
MPPPQNQPILTLISLLLDLLKLYREIVPGVLDGHPSDRLPTL